MDFRVSQVESFLQIFHKNIWQKQKTCDAKIAQKFLIQEILSGEICGWMKTNLFQRDTEKITLVEFLKLTKRIQKHFRVNLFLLQIVHLKAILGAGNEQRLNGFTKIC